MRIILAPMQGVVDQSMRELLTGLGGYDPFVTEVYSGDRKPLPRTGILSLLPGAA